MTTTLVNNDINEFLDELTVAPLDMSKEQEEAIKAFVEERAKKINAITGQSVSLSQVIDHIFYLVKDKKLFLERLPIIFEGWKLNNYELKENEVVEIINKYNPLLEEETGEELEAKLNAIAEKMPNIYTSTVKNSISQTSIEYKEEQESENKKEGAVDNTEEVKSTFTEEKAIYIFSNQENAGEPQPEIFAEPSKLSSVIIKIKSFYTDQVLIRLKKIDFSNLNSDEIIIVSIILATLIALFSGYEFGETMYFNKSGNRVMQYYYITNYDDGSINKENNENVVYNEFHFNYVLSIASFIISGGISYLYLNRKSQKNE